MLDSHNRKRQEEEEAIRTDAVELLHHSFDPERDNVIVLGLSLIHIYVFVILKGEGADRTACEGQGLQGRNAVSYTHLDVYKRQVKEL